ncbi:transmembrane protein 256 [Artemisia annua]|uniref:Transmembrane protein 256 n=1 Tax=Artemisia annua TaxID=35608 RepID=A0A2U1QB42_ARTAN|nr:transmembrane protein 256 [Artemisia annua]
MNPLIWHKVAAISGMAALGLGTYGAHGFKPTNPTYKEVWNTASLYHLVHTAALLGAPIAKNPNVHSVTIRIYIEVKGKRVTSCAASPFRIAKLILLKTTFEDLGVITLLCITRWTLLRSSTISGARKPKFGGLLATGIIAFSGTCYAVAYLEDRTYAKLAPLGGFAFIAAWGSLLF